MNRKEALKILGFNEGDHPSEREITVAYRKLALEYHPDKHSGASKDVQKQNEEKFKELGAAYKFLTGKNTKKSTKPTNEDLDINSAEDLKFYLYAALLRQDIAFLKKLFSKFKSNKDGRFGDYINEIHFGSDFPLFSAISSGNVDLVRLLLENGADHDIRSKYGESPLHEACFKGYDRIVELLLEDGADPNIKDREGKPPLSFVLKKRFWDKREVKVISLLLEHDADPNIKGQEGKSLFCYIIDSYDNTARCKAVELLLDKGVDPNIQDDRGRASLHYLCKHGYRDGGVEIAKLLLRRGADPGLKDKSGKKPIDHVNPNNDVGELFGAINYEKAAILGIAALLATTCSIALVCLAMNVSINRIQVPCFTLAAIMATAALCCACCAVKTVLFPPGPLSEFTEAREEFLKSQKLPDLANGA